MDNIKAAPAKKAKTRSLISSLLISLALLLVLNLISNYVFYRLDVSKGKIHTLSRTSKNLVAKLKDNVVVKVYLSANLPPDYNVLARYAKDLLGEYKLYGGSHFRYELVSTANEDKFIAQAAKDEIFPQRTMILENDQQTVRNIYMGIAFEYKGNRDQLNLTKAVEGRLEYEITALLRRLAKANLPKVSVYQDSTYNAEMYKYFEHHINQNYDVLPTNLTAPVMLSQVLVFPGVLDSLTQLQLYNLDQYIMHGGKVVFLQDRIWANVQYNQAQEIPSNIFKLLEHYGIVIKPNLVMDRSCAPINMSQRSGIFVVDVPILYPLIPLVQGMKSNVISKGLSDLLLYYVSELDTSVKLKGLSISPILKTSSNSGLLNGPDYDINPERFVEQKIMANLNMPPLTVAALYTGSFNSYFADKPGINATQGFQSKISNGEIIVVGDSDLIKDMIASSSDANIMFVLNAIDFLLKDVSLAEVRSRGIPNSTLSIAEYLYRHNVSPERIGQIEPKIRQTVKLLNLILPSLLLLLYGLRRMILQKRSRRQINQRFQIPENDAGDTSVADKSEGDDEHEEKPLD